MTVNIYEDMSDFYLKACMLPVIGNIEYDRFDMRLRITSDFAEVWDKRAEHIELRSIPYYLSSRIDVKPALHHLLHNGNLLPEAVRL